MAVLGVPTYDGDRGGKKGGTGDGGMGVADEVVSLLYPLAKHTYPISFLPPDAPALIRLSMQGMQGGY